MSMKGAPLKNQKKKKEGEEPTKTESPSLISEQIIVLVAAFMLSLQRTGSQRKSIYNCANPPHLDILLFDFYIHK